MRFSTGVLLAAAALPLVAAELQPIRRQASSSAASSSTRTRTRTSGSSATGAASSSISGVAPGAITTPPPFTGTLPASISSIVATITAGTDAVTPTYPLPTTFSAGASPTAISNAPALPSTPAPSGYPELDKLPLSSFPGSAEILAAVDLSGVPSDIQPSTDGSCGGSPTNLARAGSSGICWWTCGGCTRDTDVTTCPDVNTWGLSYDDGPSPYTPKLLEYLEANNLKSTFFVVGSRAISRPDMLRYEHMTGHQISVHTWSHPALTTLSNEEIVLELGWTKKVIHDITGVTPNTMRPPYGDIDDRVRAICKAMNLTPIIWTSTGPETNYDTNDWRIGAGQVTAAEVVSVFDGIIANASSLSTGYIVLAHDLYKQSVELATEVILPQALSASPKQNIVPIITCLNQPLGNAYVETNQNATNGQSSPTATLTGSNAVTTGNPASGANGNRSGAAGSLELGTQHLVGAAAVVLGALAML